MDGASRPAMLSATAGSMPTRHDAALEERQDVTALRMTADDHLAVCMPLRILGRGEVLWEWSEAPLLARGACRPISPPAAMSGDPPRLYFTRFYGSYSADTTSAVPARAMAMAEEAFANRNVNSSRLFSAQRRPASPAGRSSGLNKRQASIRTMRSSSS
jgi:hypothetical protein